MTTELMAAAPHPHRTARTGAAMAGASMLSVQLGLALSVGLFAGVGPAGAAWLRLAWGGVLLLVLVRPRVRHLAPASLGAAGVLGLVTAGLTLLFMAAVARIPLGTASALEFLGPLSVAVLRGRGARALLWPLLAGVGVVLLTEPWRGTLDLVGVAFALAAAACWAAYILLTQAVGDRVEGLDGLAISLTVAAIASTIAVGPFVWGQVTLGTVVASAGLALLVPVVPFSLEMMALRRLDAAAFGTLMCLEPGFALVIGLVLLGQSPTLLSTLGLGLVVAAGAGAQRAGGRSAEPLAPVAPVAPDADQGVLSGGAALSDGAARSVVEPTGAAPVAQRVLEPERGTRDLRRDDRCASSA